MHPSGPLLAMATQTIRQQSVALVAAPTGAEAPESVFIFPFPYGSGKYETTCTELHSGATGKGGDSGTGGVAGGDGATGGGVCGSGARGGASGGGSRGDGLSGGGGGGLGGRLGGGVHGGDAGEGGRAGGWGGSEGGGGG
jgi:hypothetical protein